MRRLGACSAGDGGGSAALLHGVFGGFRDVLEAGDGALGGRGELLLVAEGLESGEIVQVQLELIGGKEGQELVERDAVVVGDLLVGEIGVEEGEGEEGERRMSG